MNYQYPKEFARFYDIIYSHLRDGVDNKFFQKQIAEAKGRVLEVGVGTGRFFKEALEKGADIYGIDISPEMLKVLKSNLNENEHFRISEQGIVDFSFDSNFELIIAPFRVMMHVVNKDDQLRAINNVFDNLQPGGTFIFDTFVPNLEHLIKGLDNCVDFEGKHKPGKSLKRISSTKPDLIEQLIDVTFKFEWEENGMNTYEWSVPLRFFFRYELEHLIERSKFENYTILGDYDGAPLNSNSKEFIVVCHK